MNFEIDFLVAGARKCGTTWLYDNLKSHPAVVVSNLVKQSNYFGVNHNKGISWYRSLFPKMLFGDLIVGEVDPDIINFNGAAHLIHDEMPHVKIIFILRNPPDLFMSSYQHAVRKGDFSGSLVSAWRSSEIFKNEVRYGRLLEPYFRLFDQQNLKVMFYDDLVSDPASFVEKFYLFIGADPYLSNNVFSVVNERRAARYPMLSFLLARSARLARKNGLHRLVNFGKRLIPDGLLSSRIAPGSRVMAPELLSEIYADLEDDMRLFKAISGVKVPDTWF